MGASDWGTNRSVEESLFADGSEVEFFQAVRLLLYRHAWRHPDAPARLADIVRFRAHNTLAFPASSVDSVEQPEDGPVQMTVSFLGLTGPKGVLPVHYTETVVDQAAFGDTALADFLDLFNNRLVSLFYQAWEKYQAATAFEHSRREITSRDQVTSALLDLIGMGTEGLQDRLPFPDTALLRYAGLLAQRPHSAEVLRALLHDYFGLPIKIEQFIGKWHILDETDLCQLGLCCMESQLGMGAVAGDAVWSRQSLIRLIFGPLSRTEFQTFLPDQRRFREAVALTRWFLGPTLEFEIQPLLAHDQVLPCRLGEEAFDFEGCMLPESRLGWSAWMVAEPFREAAADAIFQENEFVMMEA
jgi:type VI secretion system protein ImpH